MKKGRTLLFIIMMPKISNKKAGVSIVVILTFMMVVLACSISMYYFLTNEQLDAGKIIDNNLNEVITQKMYVDYYILKFGNEVLNDFGNSDFSEEDFIESFREKVLNYQLRISELNTYDDQKIKIFKIINVIFSQTGNMEIVFEDDKIVLFMEISLEDKNNYLDVIYSSEERYLFYRKV